MNPRALRIVAFAFLASTLLAAFPSPAAAGPNEPDRAAWSPHAGSALLQALALSKGPGTKSLVAGTALVTESGQQTPGLPGGAETPSDTLAFNVTTGRLFNGTGSPEGKSAVAVSRNGKAAAVAGTERLARSDENDDKNAPTGVLRFYDVAGPAPAGPGGSPNTQAPRWQLTMPGTVQDLAMSATGRIVAVAVNPVQRVASGLPVVGGTASAESGRVLVVSDSKAVVFKYPTAGRMTSVDVSADGQWIVAGGRHIESGRAVGAVHLFRESSGTPLRTFLLEPVNASEVRDVRITPDGRTFAAVTQRGDVYVWQNGGTETRTPISASAADRNVTRVSLALSEDGKFLAASAGQNLRLFEVRSSRLVERWTHLAPAIITGVDTNATAGVIVASVGGGPGGFFAFTPKSATPYFKFPVAGASNASVSARGDLVAFTAGTQVFAYAMRHNLTFSPVAGPAPTTTPHRAVNLPLFLKNDGSIPERVQIVLPSDRHDIALAVNRSRVEIAPGESTTIGVSVTPGRLLPGAYAFNVSARSLDSSHVRNTTLSFVVTGTSDVSLDLNGAAERRVAPGGSDSIYLNAVNDGNSAVNLTLDVFQSVPREKEWQVRLVGESRFPLASGASSTLRVLVDVPQNALNGSENRVTIRATAPGKPAVTQEILYSVNPFLAVNATLPGRTKFVYAGQYVHFNVSVKNTGSVAAQFETSASTVSIVGDKHWVVDIDIRPFPLAPGENRTIPVRIVAPKDADPGERATVLFEARSVPLTPGLKQVAENVTFFANVVERPPDPNDPPGSRIPAPGLALALGAVAALALFLSNRRKVNP